VKIVIIGSGNVAFNLAMALQKKKHTILQVVGRNKITAQKLSFVLKCPFTNRWSELNTYANLYLIAVNDNEIANVAGKLKKCKGMVVHTSGSIPVSVIKNKIKNYGVFYPVQTFTNQNLNFPDDTPIAIEANTKSNLDVLKKLASQISSDVRMLSSEKRLRLHLTAVLVNNFSNHLFALAEKYLQKNKLDYDILIPLIKQTVINATTTSPVFTQTGPAKRLDSVTLKKHLALLEENKDLLKLYKLFTKSIQSFYKKK
jgi:predicted short-subunit dehydrogenase-like oxidoreductase (DUF2520 family)